MKETLNFIDGHFVASASGRLFDNRCPVDNRLVSRVHSLEFYTELRNVCIKL